jgi:hypothetical protein
MVVAKKESDVTAVTPRGKIVHGPFFFCPS